MVTAHLESTFEASIADHLTAHGWVAGTASSYDRALGLDTSELFTFIGATQIDAWPSGTAIRRRRSGSSRDGSPTRSPLAGPSTCCGAGSRTSVCRSTWPTSRRRTS